MGLVWTWPEALSAVGQPRDRRPDLRPVPGHDPGLQKIFCSQTWSDVLRKNAAGTKACVQIVCTDLFVLEIFFTFAMVDVLKMYNSS